MHKEISMAYSNALIDIAIEKSKLSVYSEQMKSIQSLLMDKANEGLMRLFNNKAKSFSYRKEVIENIFGGQVEEDIVKTLLVMAKNNELEYLNLMVELFIIRANEVLGIREGVVWSATPLLQNQLDRIVNAMKVKFNKEVKLVNKVDETLIGGVKVEFIDATIDGTVKHKLNDLKVKLKK